MREISMEWSYSFFILGLMAAAILLAAHNLSL